MCPLYCGCQYKIIGWKYFNYVSHGRWVIKNEQRKLSIFLIFKVPLHYSTAATENTKKAVRLKLVEIRIQISHRRIQNS